MSPRPLPPSGVSALAQPAATPPATSEDGLIYAFELGGSCPGRRLQWADIEALNLPAVAREDDPVLWIHLDYSNPRSRQWLHSQTAMNPLAVESLLREENRPRVSSLDGGLLLSLRSINFSAEASPEDMVALRLWTNNRAVITTRRRHILSVQHLADEIGSGSGPRTVGAFIAGLSELLVYHMQDTISEIEDRVDAIEEAALDSTDRELRMEVADVRRLAIALRRYLAPQREALTQLQHEKYAWIGDDDRLRLREATDHLHRYIEDLDLVRDRAAVTHEELVSRTSEQLNSRMYLLSIVAAIFLPLGFVTGLLGVNVGGIPGAANDHGFEILSLLLLIIILLQLVVLKHKRWF